MSLATITTRMLLKITIVLVVWGVVKACPPGIDGTRPGTVRIRARLEGKITNHYI